MCFTASETMQQLSKLMETHLLTTRQRLHINLIKHLLTAMSFICLLLCTVRVALHATELRKFCVCASLILHTLHSCCLLYTSILIIPIERYFGL